MINVEAGQYQARGHGKPQTLGDNTFTQAATVVCLTRFILTSDEPQS